MNDIIQFKITLKGTQPPIWRRVLVNRKTTFLEFHSIIQIAMGWENDHLFEFQIDNYRIGESDEEFDDFTFDDDELLDASTLTLDSKIAYVGEKFDYLYDFGDNWEHKIVVEKFLPVNNKFDYPICINGKLNCPPEDCGGVPGFYYLLDVIGNKQHPEHEEMLEWVGEDYDPEYFDKEKINKMLKEFKKYY